MVARRGRPPKHKEQDMERLVEEFEQYIEETDIPIIARFAANHRLPKQFMHDHKEFADLVKWCLAKKEAALEEMALTQQVEKTMAIFSLKQLGWRDKEAKVVFVDPKTLSDEELKKLVSDQ